MQPCLLGLPHRHLRRQECRNLIKKPWAFNPQIVGFIKGFLIRFLHYRPGNSREALTQQAARATPSRGHRCLHCRVQARNQQDHKVCRSSSRHRAPDLCTRSRSQLSRPEVSGTQAIDEQTVRLGLPADTEPTTLNSKPQTQSPPKALKPIHL